MSTRRARFLALACVLAAVPVLPSGAAAAGPRHVRVKSSLGPGEAAAVGADGSLWYAGPVDSIGHVTTGGVVQDYSGLMDTYDGFRGVAESSDGAVWFTALSGRFGRLDPATRQVTSEEVNSYAPPSKLTRGPDGVLWFTENDGAIGRLSNDGQVTRFRLGRHHNPDPITTGPDGKLWFLDSARERLGRFASDGSVRYFRVPLGCTRDIVSGPLHSLWMACDGWVVRATTGGHVKRVRRARTRQSVIHHVAAGPRHRVWYTEYNGDTERTVVRCINARGRLAHSYRLDGDYSTVVGNSHALWAIGGNRVLGFR